MNLAILTIAALSYVAELECRDSLARSGALPRVPEASGPVPDVVPRAAGEGASAPSPCVSEGTASERQILRTIPLKTCAGSGCNYPEGGCLGVCS